MEKPRSYCDLVNDPTYRADPLHKTYHDTQYGFPLKEDNELFGRLILEINQAGLSWITILKKETNFRKAYHEFNIQAIARYGQNDIRRLLNDEGIIRNRLKINAAIENARVIVKLQHEFGSFRNWLDRQHPLSRDKWTKLFKKHFRFTGGEIVNEFLMSTGYLPGAHHDRCPIQVKILRSKPPWARKQKQS